MPYIDTSSLNSRTFYRLSRNVGINYHFSLRDDPEEHSSLQLHGGSLKSQGILSQVAAAGSAVLTLDF